MKSKRYILLFVVAAALLLTKMMHFGGPTTADPPSSWAPVATSQASKLAAEVVAPIQQSTEAKHTPARKLQKVTPTETWPATVADPRKISQETCGQETFDLLGLKFDVKSSVPGTLEINQVGPNPHRFHDFIFSSRGMSQHRLYAGQVQQTSPQTWVVEYTATDREALEVDVIVTWVDTKYLGQRWFLPNRNDQPPFEEKKKKCLDLKLKGDCERFGVTIYSGRLVPKELKEQSCGDALHKGHWMRLTPSESTAKRNALLADPVGLNTFDGSNWRYETLNASCPFKYLQTADALSCLSRRKIQRVLLFGDSMVVELFNAMQNILGPDATIRQGKHKKLRTMEFKTPQVHVKFARSYTTSQGHSVIADPGTIAEQVFSFKPDFAIGNLAVLHWQQNERSLKDWTRNLERFAELSRQKSDKAPIPFKMYLGHTMIQMGRTQGLHPSRTEAFSAAAKTTLAPAGFTYVDPFQLSLPRRESAFDGQHWACYHEYGGVSHTIAELVLNTLCLN